MAKQLKYPFKGIIAPAFAPFKGNRGETLNLSVVPEYARYLAATGFKLILINGTFGEGMVMTTDERIQLANAWTEAVKQTDQELIIHVGGTNFSDVKKMAAHAQSINANAILCLPELYHKPKTVEELIDYLSEVGASAPKVPLMYYHSPAATGVVLSMVEFFEKIGNKIPTFVGIKLASTSIDEWTLAVEAAGDRFRVFTSGHLILPASIAIGAEGMMTAAMNFAPDLLNSIYNSAIAGDFVTARAQQVKLTNIMKKLNAIDKNVLPVMKALSRRILLTKFDIGTARRPLKNYDSSVEVAELASAITAELR